VTNGLLEAELPDELAEEQADEPTGALSAADVEGLVSYTLDWSVQSLLERIGTTFDVNPSFQRRDAWDPDRKSLYIESLMLALPVPQVVLAEDKDRKGSFLVLDGKQRLVTMKQFAAPNEHYPTFKLRKMEFLPQLNGMTFEQIQASITDSEYADTLLSQPVRTIVLRGWKRPEVLYQVFVRLNQNSVSLSPQELRQALFPGDFTTWINERSASSTTVHRARRIKREDFRMRDAEMLLRSIAFADRLEAYSGNLRLFLDEQCELGLKQWATRQEDFKAMADATEKAILRTFEVFTEDRSFLRFEDETYIRRFNIAVYDVMVAVLGSSELTEESIANNKGDLRSAFEYLCREDPRFSSSLTSSTKTTQATGYRINKFALAVEEVTGIHLAIGDRAATLLED
jgi:hypothetical protein